MLLVGPARTRKKRAGGRTERRGGKHARETLCALRAATARLAAAPRARRRRTAVVVALAREDVNAAVHGLGGAMLARLGRAVVANLRAQEARRTGAGRRGVTGGRRHPHARRREGGATLCRQRRQPRTHLAGEALAHRVAAHLDVAHRLGLQVDGVCAERRGRDGEGPRRGESEAGRKPRTHRETRGAKGAVSQPSKRTAVAAVLVLALQLLVRHPCRAEETAAHEKWLRNLPPPPPFRGKFRAAIDFGWGRRIDFQSDPHLRTLEVPPPGGAASWSGRKKSGRGKQARGRRSNRWPSQPRRCRQGARA